MCPKGSEKYILGAKFVQKVVLGKVGALKMRVLGLKSLIFCKNEDLKSMHFCVVSKKVALAKCVIYVYLKSA